MLPMYAVHTKGNMIRYLISDEGIFHASMIAIVKIEVMVNRSVTETPEC